jgi:beta-lactamase regulating signal transducer with metallopeptidase domain
MTPDVQLIVEFLGKHFAIAVLVLVGSLAIRKRSAAFRNSYWLIGLVWIALLPLLISRTPQIIVAQNHYVSLDSVRGPIEPKKGQAGPASTLLRAIPVGPVSWNTSLAEKNPSSRISQAGTSSTASGPDVLAWKRILVLAYAIGVGLGISRLARSLLTLRVLAKENEQAQGPLLNDLVDAARRVGLSRTPLLVATRLVSVPLTFGFFRPIVAVPSEGASSAALLHECAHIRRGDWLALLFSELISTLFWFDPLLMLISRNLRNTCESAADDVVVLSGIAPTSYANELIDFASKLSRKRYHAGLAIVDKGGLKTRIRQILGVTRRETRVPVRTVATNLLLGVLSIAPFAALHVVPRTFHTTDDGYVDFGNGNWIRVVAISEIHGNHAVSWNMKGELLPRAIGPAAFWVENAKDATGKPYDFSHVLVIATNIHDMAGFHVGQIPSQSPDLVGCSFFPITKGIDQTPQSIDEAGTWCFPITLPSSGAASLYVTTPTGQDYVPVATASYVKGELKRTSNSEFQPSWSKPAQNNESTFTAPPSVHGQLLLDIKGTKSELRQEVEEAPAENKIYGGAALYGQITQASLLRRDPVESFWIRNIPSRPKIDSIMPASLPPGLDLLQAKNQRFVFSNGQVLSLKSITRPRGKKPTFWSATGKVLKADRQGYDSSISNDYASPGESIRAIRFSLTDSPWIFRRNEITHESPFRSVYDAAGLAEFASRTSILEPDWEDFVFNMSRSETAKPQDLIVCMTDPGSRTVQRLPVAEVFREHHYGKTSNPYSFNGGTYKFSLSATRSSQFAATHENMTKCSVLTLLDSRGKPIETMGSSHGDDRDEYFIDKPASERVAQVQVETWKYVYIRFPNVAMAPLKY